MTAVPSSAVPDVAALPLEEKASLLSGANFWTTEPLAAVDLPPVVLADGPHGVRRQAADFDAVGFFEGLPATCFPPAVAVGSSWDPEVAERIGTAIAREAQALGVHVVLGPGVNIKRSPLCGRNFEYYSEDPLLAGVLGAAHVRGQEAQGVGASVKHFAANNQETERMRVSVDVDERTLREIYLPAFERVVTEGRPATVMCAYNRINGVYAAEHRWLLTQVLRGEWGFDGVVVSDWGAVEGVRAGEIDESFVDASAGRVARLARYVREPADGFDVEAHAALARELAADCVVLLKNESGTLPLAPTGRVALIGEFARTPRFQGGGSSNVNATGVESALDAVRSVAPSAGFAPGFSLDGSGDAAALRAEAVDLARGADVSVVFAGLGDAEESEGFDRAGLELPAVQVELIRAVAGASARTVVVLSNGGIVSLEGWHDEVDSIVEGFLLGQGGGAALADVLFGVVNPSGRLAETVPLRLQDTPAHLNFPGEQGHVRYGEGVMVGYRAYATLEQPVRYAFGHGLSYTTFATTDLTVEATGPDTARATATVTNTGERAGKHVVQVYVATAAGPVRRPARELRAFAKVALEPGQSRTVEFDLDRRAFAYYDVRENGWVVAPGEYVIQIGASALDVVAEAPLTLAGDDIVPVLTLDSSVQEWFGHPVTGPAMLELFVAGMPAGVAEAGGDASLLMTMVGSMPMRRFLADMGNFLPVDELGRLIEVAAAARRRSQRP